jgi:hypothetical protein
MIIKLTVVEECKGEREKERENIHTTSLCGCDVVTHPLQGV